MAFTRQNINQTSSFSRTGAVTTLSTPAFQVFSIDKTSTNYSLGDKWNILINSSSQTLDFNYDGSSVLRLESSGFSLSSVILTESSSFPLNPVNGTLLHVNNELYIYT